MCYKLQKLCTSGVMRVLIMNISGALSFRGRDALKQKRGEKIILFLIKSNSVYVMFIF